MAGTAACAIMATSTGRLVSGDERVATRATVTELGDVDRLAREGALLRIDCTILIGVSFWQLPTIVSRGGGLCHLPIPTRVGRSKPHQAGVWLIDHDQQESGQ